ncbi:hypothetical protein ACFQY4_29735 [Catellatospora bangladeshensis]|uniref:hypothetical protein n=1 Tax=Catellatospora bangladeshensis TaxID=310355 RepID=UPI003617C779
MRQRGGAVRARTGGGHPEDTAIARALDAIKRNPEAVRTAEGDRYEVWKANVTETGAAHVRFTRLFKGLPVTGGDFVVHLTPDGSFDGVSVSLEKPWRSTPPRS